VKGVGKLRSGEVEELGSLCRKREKAAADFLYYKKHKGTWDILPLVGQ